MVARGSVSVDDADVVIVGSGPAGAGAAIASASRGLLVVLIEAAKFPRPRPGETLHPGVEPIFESLGVAERVDALAGERHAGLWVQWGQQRRFVAYGDDARGPWRGYQVWRSDLDAMLLERAAELGAIVWQPCVALAPIVSGGRVVGIETTHGPVTARFMIDASGSRYWLARKLALPVLRRSARMRLTFGYVLGEAESTRRGPQLRWSGSGWDWMATLQEGLAAWACLGFDDDVHRECPRELRGMKPVGPTRGADVTWRRVSRPAGPGYFVAGDAAAILDPTSSHGVLRALMSGMMIAHLLAGIRAGVIQEIVAIGFYQRWIRQWFESDVRRLAGIYDLVTDAHRVSRDAPTALTIGLE